MNGFLILGYNNAFSDKINLHSFDRFLENQKKRFAVHKLKSNLFDNLFGYQFFESKNFVKNQKIKTNAFLNGKIFGRIHEKNLKKFSYQESVNFLQKNTVRNQLFFGFDGSCSFVLNELESITFQSDIEGYKKVFYYHSSDVFCVSSNLTHILKIIQKRWKVRRNAVYNYLIQRESKWPLTFIEEIEVLPPLTKAVLTEKKISFSFATLSDFYDLKKIRKKPFIKDLYENYERIILREDADRVAVTLSGGYDSNCLTKLYNQSYKDKFTAVSLGYASVRERDVNVYDETVYAEKIAKDLNIPFKKYIINKEYFESEVDNYIEALDQPGHDPSSNFLLNSLLRTEGFDTVVSGMGGDAFFNINRKTQLLNKIFQISKKTGSYKLLNHLSAQLNFKYGLKIFDTQEVIETPNSFLELREILKIKNYSLLKNFFDGEIVNSLYDELRNRLVFYDNIENQAITEMEVLFSYKVFSNPDEYHADVMAQRNDMNIIMPFMNIGPVLKLLNASNFVNVTSREFETEIFSGINQELLYKGKSGFSFPYTEWVGSFFEETFDFFIGEGFFNDGSFNINRFYKEYNENLQFSNNLYVNQLIWKLTVLRKYVQIHSLQL